jgi:sigma-54 specific flagellar transcriptional regulator A
LKHRIIGSSEKTQTLAKLVEDMAPTDASVLITGESGCGKELYARAIHDRSLRSGGPFIAINCGAIPSDLLESQLFGHKKGAFTGAVGDFRGKFQEANGGTLFLDEIGDMPFEMQVKLLRVLQESSITPVGSNQLIDVDVRVLAATHRNIEKDIEANRFRQDLYFRLNVLPLVVPPLRERTSEIRELVEHFSVLYCQKNKKPITLSHSFMELMESYDWPGNIRELSNTIHRFSVLYGGKNLSPNVVDPTMLPGGMLELMRSKTEDEIVSEARTLGDPESVTRLEEVVDSVVSSDVDPEFESIVMLAQGFGDFTEEQPSLKAMLSDIEQDLIMKALTEAGGNVSRCAKLLKMQRTTLIERIKKYDLQTA